jgi:hypothetical protein
MFRASHSSTELVTVVLTMLCVSWRERLVRWQEVRDGREGTADTRHSAGVRAFVIW